MHKDSHGRQGGYPVLKGSRMRGTEDGSDFMNTSKFCLDEVCFEGVSGENIKKLKTLNQVIFPINYPERVYNDILACGEISQIAHLRGKVVGGISCRLENTPEVG